MGRESSEQRCAWGLEIGGSAVRLVQIAQRDGRYQVLRFHEAALEERWSASLGLREALAKLPPPPEGEPIVLCVADEWVLYRRLDLPSLEREAMEPMVQAQAEAMLTLPPEAMAYGWDRLPAPTSNGTQPVLLCGARREALESCLSAVESWGRPMRVVPSGVACAAACGAILDQPASRFVLIDVAARHTSLVVFHDGRACAVGVLDQGGDQWTESLAQAMGVEAEQAEQAKLAWASGEDSSADQAAAMQGAVQRWGGELAHVYQRCLDQIGGEPAQACVLMGRAARTPGVREVVEAGLGLRVVETASAAGLEVSDGWPLEALWTPVGAALHALAAPSPSITLVSNEPEVAPPSRRAVHSRVLALAAWSLLALAAWYALDMRAADRLDAQAAQWRAESAQGMPAAQALALGRYLEQQPPPPLFMLDELSKRCAREVTLSEWRYDGQGRLRIKGVTRGVAGLDTTLRQLADSPAVKEVALRSATVKDDVWTFEIEMQMNPLHRYLALLGRPAQSTSSDAAPATKETP
ncbi:MAG TPA: pilus assembly protein PilM [Phycisphaeraceae bacterium]